MFRKPCEQDCFDVVFLSLLGDTISWKTSFSMIRIELTPAKKKRRIIEREHWESTWESIEVRKEGRNDEITSQSKKII